MGMLTLVHLSTTTAADGSATVKSCRALNGLLHAVRENKGTLADGVDLTLSVVQSDGAKTLLTITNGNTDGQWFNPRANSCSVAGVAGTDQLIAMPVVGTLQLAIAQGGNGGIGGLDVFVME